MIENQKEQERKRVNKTGENFTKTEEKAEAANKRLKNKKTENRNVKDEKTDNRRTDNKGAEENKNQLVDWGIFALLLTAVSGVTLWLFYHQTTGSPQLYPSDMKAYIQEMQGIDSGYSFPYPVLFKLSALLNCFTSPEMAVAVATMLLNSLAIVFTKVYFNRQTGPLLQESWKNKKGILGKEWFPGVLLSILTISLFFISMLYPPTGIYLPGIKFKYLGVFTPNPFHNATYMAARPFAILAFLWYAKLLPVYESGIKGERQKITDYILFSVFLLAATMTKPSFTIVLVGTAGLLMVFRLLKSGFRNFVPTVQLGVTFIPTFLDLLYQFKGVFVAKGAAEISEETAALAAAVGASAQETGIGFCFGEVWTQYCTNIPLAICLAVGFPLLVLALNYKELKKNSLFMFAWQVYLMSFAMAFFLYEKGFRKADFNFSWGYMYGIFFCHFAALLVLLKSMTDKKKHQPLLIGVQWLAYFCHVICGMAYFVQFLKGRLYY